MQIRKLHRDKAPDFQTIKNFSIENPECFLAHNGIPIYLLPIQDQEIVKIDFIFKAGDYAAKSALVPLSTLAMLQEGSLSQPGEEIAERLDFLGSYIYNNVTKDDATISVCCLEKHLAETMNIVTDFIINPTFPEDKFQTHIRKREERYKIDIERVEVLSQKKLANILYGGNHPYGRSAVLEDFCKLSHDDLIKFHSLNYVAENCKIIVCGNPKSQEVKNLIKTLQENGIKSLNKKFQTTNYKQISNEQKQFRIAKEQAVQSSINIGKIINNNGKLVLVYNNNSKEINTSRKIAYNGTDNNITVKVLDLADNETTLECVLDDQSTKYTRSYKKYTNTGSYNYRLYVPPTMTKRGKIPLVVYLHGTGECGEKMSLMGYPEYIADGKNYNFMVVAPILAANDCGAFSSKNVMKIINDLKAKYPIDEDRIIVTGFSMGGVCALWMVRDYPNFFSACIPVSANNTGYLKQFDTTNIWAFNGQNDKVAPASAIEEMIKSAKKGNPDHKFTKVTGEGHLLTYHVYERKDVIEWMLAQKRKEK